MAFKTYRYPHLQFYTFCSSKYSLGRHVLDHDRSHHHGIAFMKTFKKVSTIEIASFLEKSVCAKVMEPIHSRPKENMNFISLIQDCVSKLVLLQFNMLHYVHSKKNIKGLPLKPWSI